MQANYIEVALVLDAYSVFYTKQIKSRVMQLFFFVVQRSAAVAVIGAESTNQTNKNFLST